MRTPEDELIRILKRAGVDLIATLPCERVKNLLVGVQGSFEHIPLTREEAGVGISGGAALAGKRPAMIIQNSGVGNMINALLSLTSFYKLPLAIFLSHRGVYKEKIAAQRPMGEHIGGILKAAGIRYTHMKSKDELHKIIKPLDRVYRESSVHAFLLSPKIWEESRYGDQVSGGIERRKGPSGIRALDIGFRMPTPAYTRYEVLEKIAPYIKGRLVVCNLGFPAKELYHVLHQPSNFYMLGSMGMATAVGFGVALGSKKEVLVIDGDGSLLMNPGTLSTIALKAPLNLTVVVIDNGVYSSTGDQPTTANGTANLSVVAQGFGLKNIFTASQVDDIIKAIRSKRKGPKFIHVLARPGNRAAPNIPLSADEIKSSFMKEVTS